MLKRCPKCKKRKQFASFHKNRSRKNGISTYCRKCSRIIELNYYYENIEAVKKRKREVFYTPSGIFTSLKSGAKNRNTEFFIDKNEFIKWYQQQIKICFYCKIKQKDLSKVSDLMMRAIGRRRLSIDRIDSKKGYNLDNIVLACVRCNLIKSDFFTAKEMKEIAKKYIIKKWKQNTKNVKNAG